MNRFILAILVALTVLFKAGLSLAQVEKVEKLNVRGLVPGESKRYVVAQIVEPDWRAYGEKSYIGDINLGGIIFTSCSIIFNADDTLGNLDCILGHFNGTNNEQFVHLFNGFTEKFGLPDMMKDSTVRNNFGVEFKRHQVQWNDKSGNLLYITNLHEQVDRGLLRLQSRKFMIENRNKRRKKAEEGKF